MLLANLAWGNAIINKKIYKLVQILLENNIRCFEYLVNICMLIIKRLKIGYIIESEYQWEDFINKWH